MNFNKGYYKLSFGYDVEDRFYLDPPCITEYNFSNFITSDIDYEINMSLKLATSSPFINYKPNFASEIKLSLREVLDVLKASNIKVTTSEDGSVVSNSSISQDIADYFNNTGMTFKSLKKLSFLNKSIKFTDNKISLDEILLHLSDLYYSNASILSGGLDMIANIYNTSSDFKVIKDSPDVKRLLDN